MGGMIKCLKCLKIMHSLYRHDFQACDCDPEKSHCYVDGGFDYTRVGGYPEDIEMIKHIHQKDEEGKDEVILTDTLWTSLM